MDTKALNHQAMQTLRENHFDIIAQKEAFSKLKASVDRNDLNACWMVAACFINFISVPEFYQKILIGLGDALME